jgi:4-hydroxy-tetrahydrodipicolinate synthase
MAAASWAGVFPSIPTAFARDGSLDLASQAAVARFAVESGSHGLLCFGLAGEVFRLTPGERREALEAIVEAVGGRIPVLTGVGAESLHTSLALARQARDAGADGVVLPPPVTTRPTRPELMRYFAEIATAAELPAMVQDAPEFLGVELGPELVLELARTCSEIGCVKLESGAERIAEWVAQAEGLPIFGGNAGLYMLDSLDCGAAGIAPGAEVADEIAAIYGLWRAGDPEAARRRFERVLPLLVFEVQGGIEHLNACTKHLLSRRGVLAGSHMRAPARGLTDLGRRLAEQKFDRLGEPSPE